MSEPVPESTVKVIPIKRYKQLMRAEAKLTALERGGVDNWDWYEASLEDHYVDPFGESDE